MLSFSPSAAMIEGPTPGPEVDFGGGGIDLTVVVSAAVLPLLWEIPPMIGLIDEVESRIPVSADETWSSLLLEAFTNPNLMEAGMDLTGQVISRVSVLTSATAVVNPAGTLVGIPESQGHVSETVYVPGLKPISAG
jgi:hypothetical protein